MIRSKLTQLLVLSLMVFGLTIAPLAPTAGAINVFGGKACGAGNAQTDVCKAKSDSIQPLVRKVINVLLIVLGIISVIMIIVGGLKYTISDGDTSKVKSAKDTILYSVVGLVIALFAYAIVNFVIAQLG